MSSRKESPLSAPESLETRLALAGLVQFTDVDGDLVRVASSRGTDQQLAAAIHLLPATGGAVAGSRTVASIDLTQPVFAATALSISVRRPPGGRGDGGVELGRITTGAGGISAVTVDGSFSSLIAAGSVGTVTVRGPLRAGATIRSDRTITDIAISGSIEGTAAAPVVIAASGDGSGPALGRVSVGGNSSHARILAGYDTALRGVSNTARIESVVITGAILGTDVVAGIASPDRGLAFGGATDRAIDRGDRSRIGSVRVGRVVSTPDPADVHAIAANAIGAVFVGGAVVAPPADWQSQRIGTSDLVVCDVAPTPTPYTDFIADAIRAMERRTGSDTGEGILWGVSDGNALPGMDTADPSWVIRTQDAWGATGAHDSSAVQRQLLDTISDIIAGAKTVVDVSSLADLADGGFLEAIKEGARRADAAGNRPVIRLLWGRTPLNALDDWKLQKLLDDVQQAAPNLTVIASLMADVASSPLKFSWNHSKIVAADGQVAFVGGINMWAKDYLQSVDPVTDVGVVVRGPAAADAQQFLDVLWRYAHADHQTAPRLMRTTIVATPGTDLAEFLSLAPARGPAAGDVRVMAVGRAGFIGDQFIATGRTSGRNIDNPVSAADQKAANWTLTSTPSNGPTTFPGRNTWDGNNPSDTALRALVDSAKTSVVISQQSTEYPQASPVLPYSVDRPAYDVRLFDALARKVRDGIPVTIIVSNTDRRSGDYRANAVWTTDVMIDRLTTLTGSRPAAVAAASRSLVVAPFRYSDSPTWPGRMAGPGLHSKVVAVDDRAVYVGSQNAYPDEQQEFGFIVEDRAALADFNRLFLAPSIRYSTPALRPAPREAIAPGPSPSLGAIGPALGTFRGSFDTVNIRPLYFPGGAELQNLKRWMSASVSTRDVFASVAVVDTGKGLNAFFYCIDLASGGTIVSKSAVGIPPSSAELLDRPGSGARAVFRGSDFRLSITRGEAAGTYEVEAVGGGFQMRATLDAASGPAAVSAVVPTALPAASPGSRFGSGGVLATVKSPLLPATGFIRGGGRAWSLAGGNGAIDFTQGVIPQNTRWEQASLGGTATDGTRVAVNLTTNLSPGKPGANAVWAGSSLASVAAATFRFDSKRWQVKTADGAVDLQFEPRGIHREGWNVSMVRGGFVQVAGRFSGTVRAADGRVLTLRDVPGMIETQDVTMLSIAANRR